MAGGVRAGAGGGVIVRVLILSSSPTGFGSFCLPALAAAPGIDVVQAILNEGAIQRPWQRRWRKLRKIARIGPLGAWNGVRMRAWYDLTERLKLEPLELLAQRHNVPFATTPSMFAPQTVELCRAAGADIGLSLGNGYIPRRVFAVPRLGMLNIHHEMLPQFQGAQSVIWQLHEGSARTGFTIHRIDDKIDTGEIVYQEQMKITFASTLAETVTETYARQWEASRDALVRVLQDFDKYAAGAKAQASGRTFTTPSYWQFRRIEKQFQRLRKEAAR
ncbi:MAG: methionyl-tRNA formyltransferase [Phycisphaerales bacterium]|nr:methionyl-tRNA formyltransferase [Phycisphaerales bacterium]